MKKLLLCFVVLGAALASPTFADDLNDALTAAYKNNPELKAKREGLKATDERKAQALSGWRPTLGYTYSAERTRIEAEGIDAEIDNISTHSVNATQPVFDGFGTIAESKRADNLIKAGREDLKSTEQDILLQAATSYLNVVRYDSELKLSQKNRSVLNEQLKATKERFNVGEVTRTDVAQSKSRLAGAVSEVAIAKGNYQVVLAEFRRVTGIEPVSPKMPAQMPKIPKTADEAIEKALVNNPILLTQRYRTEAAENNVDVVGSNLLPSVNLQAEAAKINGGTTYTIGDAETGTISVNVSVPIYQSGKVYSQRREAKRLSHQERLTLENSQNQIKESVLRIWQQIKTSTATIRSTKQAVKSAKIALDGTRQEARYGSRTTLDVLDAERELFIAQVSLVRARTNKMVAVYQMKSLLGDLTAKGLELEADIYNPEEHYKKTKYKFIGF